jgi:outer membrane lipoprotein-sorting protein
MLACLLAGNKRPNLNPIQKKLTNGINLFTNPYMTLKIKTLASVLFLTSRLLAQSDVASKNILSALSKKFNTYDVIKTNFTLTINNAEAKNKQTQEGILYLKSKTNKYKIVFEEQEILSDGKSQWTYLKADNEVQLSNISKEEEALNPAQIFTAYNKGYKTRFNGETKVGTTVYQNIEMAPVTNKSFFKIKMMVYKANNQLYSLSVYDKNGNIYTYTIKKLEPINGIVDAFFVWDKKKFATVDMQDLR